MKSALIFFLLFPLAFSSISTLTLDGSLSDSGQADIVIISQFNDSAGKTVFLNVSGPLEVVVKDKTGLVIEHQLAKSGNGTLIYAVVPLDYLRYEITSDSLTRKTGSLWNFELSLSSSEPVSFLQSSISLPRWAVLKNTNGAVSYSSDSLSLIWKASGIGPNNTARMRAGYEIEEVAEDSSGVFILAAVALVLLAGVALYLMKPKAAPKEESVKTETAPKPDGLESNAVFRTLDEIDKEIVREIARREGKTTQATIYLNTHIPKATLSRRLASLENRGIIIKSQKGNRNLVSLSEAVK